MSTDYSVVGHFQYLDDTTSAIASLKERGCEDFEVFAPMPLHELEDAIYYNRKRSPIRQFTLFGAISGCLGGFLMTSWMSLDWPLRTSAKTILSFPAFVVIAFECTILLGAIATLIGLLHNCRIPSIFPKKTHRPQFSEGTFGVSVRVPKDEAESMKGELEKFGAKKVELQYVR